MKYDEERDYLKGNIIKRFLVIKTITTPLPGPSQISGTTFKVLRDPLLNPDTTIDICPTDSYGS